MANEGLDFSYKDVELNEEMAEMLFPRVVAENEDGERREVMGSGDQRFEEASRVIGDRRRAKVEDLHMAVQSEQEWRRRSKTKKTPVRSSQFHSQLR
ncbi:hypothetical protein ACSBR2_027412 [Camellia fascicularis]